MIADRFIEMVLNGQDLQSVLDEAQVGIPYAGGVLRTFFDSQGDLRFCTEDDILIDPKSDVRLKEIVKQSANTSFDDILGTFSGTLDELVGLLS